LLDATAAVYIDNCNRSIWTIRVLTTAGTAHDRSFSCLETIECVASFEVRVLKGGSRVVVWWLMVCFVLYFCEYGSLEI
jgi:hypothetical protein